MTIRHLFWQRNESCKWRRNSTCSYIKSLTNECLNVPACFLETSSQHCSRCVNVWKTRVWSRDQLYTPFFTQDIRVNNAHGNDSDTRELCAQLHLISSITSKYIYKMCVVAAYIMKTHGMGYNEAMNAVKVDAFFPAPNFVNALVSL